MTRNRNTYQPYDMRVRGTNGMAGGAPHTHADNVTAVPRSVPESKILAMNARTRRAGRTSDPMVKLAVLMTCHNRKETTLACLDALKAVNLPARVAIKTYLVDDASTDGTAEAISQAHPDVVIIHGDGSLYWNRGMRLAWDTATGEGADFYLWLNDDTLLEPDALSRLLATHKQVERHSGKGAIVVGSTLDHDTSEVSYGGVVSRSRLRPITFDRLAPGGVPIRCDTFNGNIVLVPANVAALLGNLDPAFIHTMGDTDYGLRARKAGCANWVMPGCAGTCSRNAQRGTFLDTSLTRGQRFRAMFQPKGLPLKPWMVLTRRHTGPLWILYWLWPYVRVLVE